MKFNVILSNMENIYIHRDFEEDILSYVKGNGSKIAILIGARQVGKSSFLKNYLKNNENTVYFDLEKPEEAMLFNDYRNFLPLIEKNKTLLVDEFYIHPESTKVFKILYDHNPKTKIIASGSSSLAIRKSLKESLAGRKRIFDIYPLSFKEFLRFKYQEEEKYLKNLDILNPDKISTRNFNTYINENLLFGFLPKVTLINEYLEKRLELQDIYQSYIIRDIKSFIKEAETVAFNKLVMLLSSSISSLTNYNELSNTIGVSRYKIEEYTYVLEQTYILKRVSPFEANIRRELTKMHKIYFMDIGLRNQIINNFSNVDIRSDIGHLFENLTYIELIKTKPAFAEIFFWRSTLKSEIDFILKNNDEIILVECKKGAKDGYCPKIFYSFSKNVKFKYGIVITQDNFYSRNIGNWKLLGIPIWAVSKIWNCIS